MLARTVDGPVRADRLADALLSRAWNRISAGAGSKGERDYDWAWIAIIPPDDETGGHHSLLVRRWDSWYRHITLVMSPTPSSPSSPPATATATPTKR